MEQNCLKKVFSGRFRRRYTHIIVAFDFDGAVVLIGIFLRAEEVDPDVPVSVIVPVALSEEVTIVQDQMVTDPHDFPGEVVRVDNEVGLDEGNIRKERVSFLAFFISSDFKG